MTTSLNLVSKLAVALLCVSVFLILVPVTTASGQQPPPQRDASAIATLGAAVAALGGQASVNLITDSVSTGTNTPTSGKDQSASFTWKTLATQFRYETLTGTNSQTYVSGYGSPATSKNGSVSALPLHVSLASPAFHIAAVLLSEELNDATYTLIAMGKAALPSGQSAIQVRTISNAYPQISSVTQQDWYFDPKTGVPLRVEYSAPTAEDSSICLPIAMDFSNYQQASGILVPMTIALSQDGSVVSTVTISGVHFNVGLGPSEFSLPIGSGK